MNPTLASVESKSLQEIFRRRSTFGEGRKEVSD
jgi:hypothetical protein